MFRFQMNPRFFSPVFDEIFEIYKRIDCKTWEKLGLERRGIVHKQGLWHRTVNVLVFNEIGQLLIQKRASSKDVCPNLWDLSVTEHLKPNELPLTGAVRGLKEELGLTVKESDLDCIMEDHEQVYDQDGVKDYEIVNTFCCQLADSELCFDIDAKEVSQVVFIRNFKDPKYDFTPWYMSEMRLIQKNSINLIKKFQKKNIS